MTESQNPAPRGVRCETHGLLYDPNQGAGCVLCRREAGQPVQAATAPPAGGNAMRRALAITAGLILVTSLGFYAAHQGVIDMIAGFTSGEAFQQGLSSEEMSNAGVDPRLQEALDAIEELEEIEAKRFGTPDGDEGDDQKGDDYGGDDYGEDY